MIRLILLTLLFWADYFLVGAFDEKGRSVSDFERVQISNYRSYLRWISGRPRQIVIEVGGKEYIFSPQDELMPEGVRKLAEILPILDGSTEGVLWVEESQGRHWVMGLEVDGRLIISPAQGVKFHDSERKVALWGAGGFFAMAVVYYFCLKKYYGLDWKLSRKNYRKF